MDSYKYTVLLVDDEEEVIQVIMKKIDWEGLGFSVIGYANNGVKALEMVEEYQPDVVMTDIRMPYMDGMELAHRIREEFPGTKILIFTGFDEFEYAKGSGAPGGGGVYSEAGELRGDDQSIRSDEAKLDQEISEKRNAETLQRYYLESLPLLQANFYTTLIEGRIREEELEKYLQDYQISLPGPCFCCLVVHTSATQTPEGMSPLLLSTSVQKQAQERLEKRWRTKEFAYLGNTVLLGPASG